MIYCDTFLKNINIPTILRYGKSIVKDPVLNPKFISVSASPRSNQRQRYQLYQLTCKAYVTCSVFAADGNHVSAPNQWIHKYLLIALFVLSAGLGTMAGVKKSKRYSQASSKGQGRRDYNLGQAGLAWMERHSQILKWHFKSYGKTADRSNIFYY